MDEQSLFLKIENLNILLLCFTQTTKVEETNDRLLAALKADKEELESLLSKEKMQTVNLKQELTEAENLTTDMYKVILLLFCIIISST